MKRIANATGEAEEIEITPAMIEAGADKLAYFYSDLPSGEYEAEVKRVLTEIFTAMISASPAGSLR